MRMPDPITEPDPAIRVPEAERPSAIKRLASCAADVAEQLRSRSTAAGTVGQLLEATAAMATDPDLIADASTRILDHGLTPERAIWEAIGSVADTIRGAGSRQAERVSDLYDIRNRIVSSLTGRAVPGVPDPGHPFVLLAVDLAPAEAAGLDATRCLAIVTEEGGPTSHTAIIARSLGIPAVVAARDAMTIPDGTLLLVDGSTGEVIKEPTTDQQATAATPRRPHREKLTSPGSTADGHRVALLANIGPLTTHPQPSSAALKALGCTAPSSASSTKPRRHRSLSRWPPTVPCSRASVAGGWWCVLWTLAPTRHFRSSSTARSAANPALGIRGFRIADFYPQVLHDQLKAIKEAAAV